MCAFKRRALLKAALAVPALVKGRAFASSDQSASRTVAASMLRRVRPNDPEWPSPERWQTLGDAVGGRLSKLASPFAVCRDAPDGSACSDLFRKLKNPYFIGDSPALTQSCGWVDAWTSMPSAYAVAAASTRDVVKSVDFAREHRLRLVVKGGGHSYQGNSSAADSLLVWTRNMQSIELSEAFVAQGCEGRQAPQPAVSVGAGAIWMHVYDAVTTRGGRYVQGGGCGTVGVAGLVQSGGFGSFSKRYGLAAGSLLEARIVTADGKLRVANACLHPDLFWALKGGGGGTFGVVTSVTLKTHDLPRYFGGIWTTIKAASPTDFRSLIARFVAFYADSLFNEHWGETVSLQPDNTLRISMLFQGLSRDEANQVWKPFIDWIAAAGHAYTMSSPQILAVAADRLWDPVFMNQHVPGAMKADDRPGASPKDVFWANDQRETGWFLYGYESIWLPATMLGPAGQTQMADALFDASRHWTVGLHFNKGLAGASNDAQRDARDTAMNPAVLDAFALAIIGAEGPPAYPGLAGREPDLVRARNIAGRITLAVDTLRRVAPRRGAYVAESNFFESDWQQAYWGANYGKLLAIKHRYDQDGLFFAHNGVGSEQWSPDGFARLAG